MDQSKKEVAQVGSGPPWIKLAVLFVVVGLVVVGYTQFGGALELNHLASREAELRDFQAEHPVLVYGIAFLIYVSVTGLSLPGAAALSLVFAWYFGFWRAMILISFASTTGATIAFLLSRYLFRDSVQRRFGDRLTRFNEALRREGAFYLFTLRLIPAVPFFVINVVMGLTPVRPHTFWWVSQIGMLPGTAVYVWAGSSVPSLQQLAKDGIGAVLSPWQLTQIAFAFAMLGIFPLIVKKLVDRFRASSDNKAVPPSKTDAGEVVAPCPDKLRG